MRAVPRRAPLTLLLIPALVPALGARIAAAEEPREVELRERLTQFSAPLVLGGTNEGDGGFVWGLRPEVVTSWTVERGFSADRTFSGLGLGGYAELLRANGSTIAGAGLTFLRCTQPFAVAPSVGIYHRWGEGADPTGIAASLYAGLRFFELGSFDLPFGFRLEYRYGLGASTERSFQFTVDLDVLVGIGLVAGVIESVGKP
jgi:hypothetical protein